MKALFLSPLLFVAFLSGGAKASEKDRSGPRHVRIQTMLIEIPLTIHTELFDSPLALPTFDAAWQLVEQKKAKLINSDVLICRSGEKATHESYTEWIYPTEYAPPCLPCAPGGSKHFKQKTNWIRPDLTTPTAFETRNVGNTLEMEPTIGEGIIDIRLAAEYINLSAWHQWFNWKDQWGEAGIRFPDFYTRRVNLATSVVRDRYGYLTSFTPYDATGRRDPSRKQLFFIKATPVFVSP
ncbi:hypothetical protein HW115_09255 [Verrucomicrobiaceae bacterium N1E253]|uniref:Uncharacterized protein n=1 Tax=Oceaniferula marina TaxID=2748318 RepID=A0A851GEE6_9BACT|nr:hypothetical protein [Oceaniferula marina]NWK55796.1 hypothetical protein [Oceaniferula marina]